MNESPRRPLNMPHESTDAAFEEVHLSDYIRVLFRRRQVFLVVFATVLCGVTLFTLLSRPIYETSATLLVRSDKVRGGFLDDLGLSRENPVLTEIEILKARTNVEEVVQRLRLDWEMEGEGDFQLATFAPPPGATGYRITLTAPGHFAVADADGKALGSGTLGTPFYGAGLSVLLTAAEAKPGTELLLTARPFAETVVGVRERISAAEVGKGTNIIKVTYRDGDPRRVRDVVNTLTQVYLERSVAVKSQEASRTVEFVGGQIDQVRANLDTSEKELETYKSSSGIVKLDSEAESLIALVGDAEKARAAVQLRRHQAGFAAEALRQALARKLPYAPAILLDDPVVGALAKRLAELEVERRAQQVELTEAHPLMLNLQAQIREVQEKLLANYEAIAHGLKDHEGSLSTRIQGYETSLKGLPAAERDLARLTRLARVNADIYTFLLQKHEEARIAQAATISSISVVDPALVPERAAKPQKKKNLLLGLVVGLMLGVGAAFFVDYLDDSIRDGDTASRLLGWPVLAVVPFIAARGPGRDAPVLPEDQDAAIRRTLVTHSEPKSIAAEGFRALRTSLHFARLGQDKQVLLVTSALPGEGKSTISANLAVTIAQTGVKVLLIGCDLRKPTLHQMFAYPRTPGLSEVLIGDAGLDEALHRTQVEHLDCLGAGTTPPNPAELLNSPQMAALMVEVRRRYGVVILDAPPVLAVTDASILTAHSDTLLVVLAAGHVPVKAARRMRELLLQAEVTLAGLVLNDRSARGFEYYGRDHYGYIDEVEETVSLPRRLWQKLLQR